MYEAYFDLTNLPFRLAPDSRFYVDTPTHREALQALRDRLAQGDEFVPLIGEYGTGKTIVGRRLLDEMASARQVGAALPALRLEGDQLFDRVAAAFGLPRDKSLRPLESAIRQFEGLVRDGREAVLLVDDAHQLDAAVLRRLRKLTAVHVDGRAALRVCLAGRSTPGFEELPRFGHALSVGTPVRLEPLDAAGTHAYVLDRLRRAGWRGRPDFEAATEAIHARCAGNPAHINRLCGHILLHLYMQGRDDVNAEVVAAVDDLQQAELRGEFATLALPPLEHRAPFATQASPAAPTGAPLHGDALMAQLIAQSATPEAVQPPDTAPAPAPAAAPEVPEVPASAPPAIGRQHGRLARAATALALMATGGVLWQVISSFTIDHCDAPRQAARTVPALASTSPAARDVAPLPAAAPDPAALSTQLAAADASTWATPPVLANAGLAAMAEEIIERSPQAASAPAGHGTGKD